MEKVFPADRYSAVAISGSAAFSTEMVRLFQVQLEHYEKVEGVALSLEGKANQLAQMVRTNLGMAMQGFVVVPLFCGFDVARARDGSSTTTLPAATTRRPTSRPPARVARTPDRPSGSATARTWRSTTPSSSRSCRCTRRRTPTARRAVRTWCAASTRSSPP